MKKIISKRKPVPVIQVYFNNDTIGTFQALMVLSRSTGFSVSEVAYRVLLAGLPSVQKSLVRSRSLPLGND